MYSRSSLRGGREVTGMTLIPLATLYAVGAFVIKGYLISAGVLFLYIIVRARRRRYEKILDAVFYHECYLWGEITKNWRDSSIESLGLVTEDVPIIERALKYRTTRHMDREKAVTYALRDHRQGLPSVIFVTFLKKKSQTRHI